DRADWSSRMVKLGYRTLGDDRIDQHNLQRARFELKEAEADLLWLKGHHRQKELARLQADLEKARTAEQSKDEARQEPRRRESQTRQSLDKHGPRGPDDHVMTLYDEALAAEDRVVTLLREASQLQDRASTDAAVADRLNREQKARRDEAQQ